MARRTKEIRDFILNEITEHPKDVVAKAMEKFGLTRQAIINHINALVKDRLIEAEGRTRQRTYKLKLLETKSFRVSLQNLEEDKLWREKIDDSLKDLPENMIHIWNYGFSEIVNNAVDHSAGTDLNVVIRKTAATVEMFIADNGIGIFKKIKNELNLEDERHAILELAKGKLTTDPSRHTGEGIFFTSRMFDHFMIFSGGVFFSHDIGQEEDWIWDRDIQIGETGTVVYMSCRNLCPRTTREVFNKYQTSKEDYGFNKTIIAVRLLKHGMEQLISRSQAKRLLARFERFKVVVLDFSGVDAIGNAFADEIFRVYPSLHPEVKLVPANTNSDIKKIIRQAKKTKIDTAPILFKE